MPKEPRPLGHDSPHPLPAPRVHQGVRVNDDFPKASLAVSLDSLLNVLEDQAPDAASPPNEHGDHEHEHGSSLPDLLDVSVNLIDQSPYQPRLVLTDEEQERNTTSIAVSGRVNRPLLLRRKDNGRFELIGGATRLKSVISLGWPKVPARIVDVDDDEAQLLAISDNEGHKELTDFEKGRGYSLILARGKIKSARALAERIGSSPATVTRCLAFMKLPQPCISFLEENPATLGSKLISEFVEAGSKHPALMLDALVKIEQECISQEAALRWLKHEIATLNGTAKTNTNKVSNIAFGARGKATIVRRNEAISLKLPKGSDMDAVESAILEAINALSKKL